jgi:hypothetical protein
VSAGTPAALIADMKNKSTASKKLEGEGSYSGTRGYNKGLAAHMKSADIGRLAKKAAKALDGKEGASLRKAEKSARSGPKAASSSSTRRAASAHR